MEVLGRLAKEILARRVGPAILVRLEKGTETKSADVVVEVIEVDLLALNRLSDFLAV